MLLGQGKHGGKAWQLYTECKANGDKLPVEAYGFVLERINTQDDIAGVVEQIKKVLEDMKEAGVAPTNDTLMALLHPISILARGKEYETCCRRALDFLAEFRVLGVEFSLGVYKYLLDIFVPTGSDTDKKRNIRHKNNILASILDEIEGKEFWPATHLKDFNFFPTAMKVCNVQSNAGLAWRLDKYLNTGNNSLLLSDFLLEAIYYTNFLNTILQNDSFEAAMKLHNEIVPHSCTPMYNYFSNLLNHLHTSGGLQHLPKVQRLS